eukprot:RCo022808
MAQTHFFRSASSLSRAIQSKRITSVDALQYFLRRVDVLNKDLRAVIWMDAEAALRRAEKADEALAKGDIWGTLHGVPMLVKDSWEAEGQLCTSGGFSALGNHRPRRSADAVQRLSNAGAVIFGRTNMPMLAGDWQTYNRRYGLCSNPWNLARTPGGSSGGSAAALAAGLTPLELGSDMAGSIRLPCHFCGVYGHRPTFGVVPTRGHLPGSPGCLAPMDMVVAGPMARTPQDLVLALDVLAGGPSDVSLRGGLQAHLPRPTLTNLRQFRIGVWVDDPLHPLGQAVGEKVEALVQILQSSGATVKVVPSLKPFGMRMGTLRDIMNAFWPLFGGVSSNAIPERMVSTLKYGLGPLLGALGRLPNASPVGLDGHRLATCVTD